MAPAWVRWVEGLKHIDLLLKTQYKDSTVLFNPSVICILAGLISSL